MSKQWNKAEMGKHVDVKASQETGQAAKRKNAWGAFCVTAAVAISAASISMPLSATPLPSEAGAVLTLPGSATMTLKNDEATIVFTTECQKADARAAQKEVTAAADKALEALRSFDSKTVVAETTGLSTWPVYRKAKEGEVATVGAWGVRETVTVKVKDVSLVSKVLEAAGRTMNYDGISFGVSTKARDEADDKLLEAAIADAGRSAEIAARAMGLSEKNVRIESISVGSYSQPAVRYYAASRSLAAANKADAAAPAVSAGTAEVTLRVTMSVRITP